MRFEIHLNSTPESRDQVSKYHITSHTDSLSFPLITSVCVLPSNTAEWLLYYSSARSHIFHISVWLELVVIVSAAAAGCSFEVIANECCNYQE